MCKQLAFFLSFDTFSSKGEKKPHVKDEECEGETQKKKPKKRTEKVKRMSTNPSPGICEVWEGLNLQSDVYFVLGTGSKEGGRRRAFSVEKT